MSTDTIRETTLEGFLRRRLLSGIADAEPTGLEIFHGHKVFLESAVRFKIGERQRTEDFAIGNIPESVSVDDIHNYVTQFYQSRGYAPTTRAEVLCDLGFRKGEEKLGVNVTYATPERTCLVTVLD